MDPLHSTASEIRTIQRKGWRGGLRLFSYVASAAALYWAVFHMPIEGDDHAYASLRRWHDGHLRALRGEEEPQK